MTENLNPLFVAYAAAHQRTPEEQLEFDAAESPGGAMVGFICWMSEQREDFNQRNDLPAGSMLDREAFHQELLDRYTL